MTLDPLLSADQPVPVHAALALLALFVGVLQFALPKGTVRHRVMGWVWVLSLSAVAVTSFWIHGLRTFGPFGPIHALSVYALVGLFFAVRHARRGNVAAHRSDMMWIFGTALLVAGAFTLYPGRTMHQVVFGR